MPLLKTQRRDTDIREGPVKTEAEIGMMMSLDKDCGRGKGGFSPRAFGGCSSRAFGGSLALPTL